LAEHVGVNAPGNANNAMVLPAVVFATSTALGPMLQPSPSTSEYSIRVVCGNVSPTLIMVSPSFILVSQKQKNDPLLWVVFLSLAEPKPFGH
jgi:hypothetical protein